MSFFAVDPRLTELTELKEEVAQLKLTQDLAAALRKRVFRYSESKISRGSNKKLRQRLKKAYGGAEKSG